MVATAATVLVCRTSYVALVTIPAYTTNGAYRSGLSDETLLGSCIDVVDMYIYIPYICI